MNTKRNRIGIPKKGILIFVSLIPYLKPDYFSYVPGVNKLYVLMSYIWLLFLVMQFMCALICKKIKIHFFVVLVLMLNVLPNLRMFIVSGWNGEPLKALLNTIALILIIEIYQNDWNLLIRTIMVYFEFTVYLNFLTLFIFPNGLYHEGLYTDNWLLGYANSEIKYLILAGLVAIIYDRFTHQHRRSILLCIVVAISIVRLGAVTGIIGMLIMVALYWLQKKKIKILNLKNIAIVTAIAFVYFIVEKNIVNYVELIKNLTGKTVTFISRFDIWNKTISFWMRNPLFGWGCKAAEQRGIEYNNIYATNAHNTYLEYMYLGGIIELLIFIAIIYFIYQIGKTCKICQLKFAIYSCIGGFLVMMLTEAYIAPVVQLIYLISYFTLYNCSDLIVKGVHKSGVKLYGKYNRSSIQC